MHPVDRDVVWRSLALVLALTCLARAQDAPVQEPPAVVAPAPADGLATTLPTQQQVEQELALLRESTELDETTRGLAVSLWEQALSELRLTQDLVATTQSFDTARTEAPARLEALRAQLAAPPGALELPPVGASLTQVQEALDLAQAEVVQAEQALAALESERTHRATRRAELPGLIAQARQAVNQPPEPAAPGADAAPAVSTARRGLELVQRARNAAQLAAHESELASYEARGELLTARLDAALRAVQRGRARVEALTERVTNRRRADAEAAARSAAERVNGGDEPPLVRELAEQNARLTARRVEVTELLTRTGQLALELARQLADLDAKRTRVNDKVRIAGFTDSIALLLRRHANELPEVRVHRSNLRARRDSLNTIELETLEVEDERAELFADLDAAVERRLAQLDPDAPAELRASVEDSLRELTQARLTQLTALKADLDITFAAIVDANTVEQQLVLAVSDYERFIDEHVLWVVSTAPLGLGDVRHLGGALAWLLDGPAWAQFAAATWEAVERHPATSVGTLFTLLLLLLMRPVLRRRVVGLAHPQRTGRAPSVKPLLFSLLLTLVNSAVLPLMLLLVGWWLLRTGNTSDRAPAVAHALQGVAPMLFAVSLLRRAALPSGLADAHLRWPREALQSVRRHVALLGGVAVPAIFVAQLMRNSGDSEVSDSLGRIALMVALLTLAVFLQRLLRPEGAVLSAGGRARTPGMSYATRRLWYPVIVLVPVALTIAAGVGFHYTAIEIGARLFETWLLVLVVMLARSAALRILVIEQRKLRLDQARRRREAQKSDEALGDASVSVSGSEIMAEDHVDEVDLALVDVQTRRILGTSVVVAMLAGLGYVWAKVLPALGALERVEIWSVTRAVLDEAGSATHVVSVPVSLGDLMVAIITLGVVIVAVRNIPGLLELAVLRRLPLAPGMSYAITTLVRYVLVASGVIIASSQLGLSWEKVQWLVAAVSVGLGFGLQEIFANFVSGLIILFERPVRMGDIVTVSGVEGVITRIRIRATTIRDWDRRELLVPNREFITGQLINWTLTDPITRVVFPVGVAYGSDTALVSDVLLRVARAHPLVLSEPEPGVLFRAFGDSSLEFHLRVFIGTRDHWPRLTHELNSNIAKAFADAGIEIPFPQRDVHVRTFGPGVASVLGDPPPASS